RYAAAARTLGSLGCDLNTRRRFMARLFWTSMVSRSRPSAGRRGRSADLADTRSDSSKSALRPLSTCEGIACDFLSLGGTYLGALAGVVIQVAEHAVGPG